MALGKTTRRFFSFTITGAQTLYDVAANVAAANNPFGASGIPLNCSEFIFMADANIHFQIDNNTGQSFPLTANVIFSENTGDGTQITNLYITTTGTTTVYVYTKS